MRIVIVAAVYPPEPVVSSRILYDLACSLSRCDDVVILRPRPSRPHGFVFENFIDKSNIRVVQLNSFVYSRSHFLGRFLESFSFGIHAALYLLFNFRRYDCVYNGAWPLFGQLFVSMICALFKKKTLLPIQDTYPEAILDRIPRLFRWCMYALYIIDRINMKLATHVYTISENMRLIICERRGINIDKISLIYNWQKTDDFPCVKPENNSNRFSFMYLGNVGRISGIIKLIDLFQQAELADCDLHVAGSGSMRQEAEEYVLKTKIDNVYFIDVPFGKVDSIQQMSDVLLLFTLDNSSIYSVPSKLPAYMMSSKPVLAFVHPDSETARIVNSSKCGWVVDAKNDKEFINLLRQIPKINKDTLDTYGRNGSNYARENLSERNLTVLVNLLENL